MAMLSARVVERSDIRPEEAAAMFALYEAYYEATSRALFEQDLAAKSHVIELRADGRLAGFSTLALMTFRFDGTQERAIFSGDTIIHHDFWGEQALAVEFCRFAGALKAARPQERLFWFLISKGHRTYRYLGLFARAYAPHHAAAAPAGLEARLRQLAHAKFGDAYDAIAGVVRFAQSRGHLKPRWAQMREQLHAHPAVRFFLERNPGYGRGEELACLAELEERNLRSIARRAFLEGFGERARRAAA